MQDSNGSNQNERLSFAYVDDTCIAKNEDSTYGKHLKLGLKFTNFVTWVMFVTYYISN